jgi:predicted anti-sigma-YlaC factor YlaD
MGVFSVPKGIYPRFAILVGIIATIFITRDNSTEPYAISALGSSIVWAVICSVIMIFLIKWAFKEKR